jgi:hypothetical protein
MVRERDTTDGRKNKLDICIHNILSVYTPINALNKMQFIKVLKLLYILALKCHPQGVTEQRNISPTCLSRYYTACFEMFKLFKFKNMLKKNMF